MRMWLWTIDSGDCSPTNDTSKLHMAGAREGQDPKRLFAPYEAYSLCMLFALCTARGQSASVRHGSVLSSGAMAMNQSVL